MKTYIKSIFGMMAVSAMALAGGCTSEIQMPEQNIPDDASGVRFSMGGSALAGGSTRASESDAAVNETSTDEEKAVKNLLAVVFKDGDKRTVLGQQNAVDDEDKCFRVIDIIKDSSQANDVLKPDADKEEYFFYLREMGHFHICFVANADETLENALRALAASGSTYSDYKNLTVTQAPDSKENGMVMTTGSYGVVIDGVTTSNLQTIKLKRIMSRIDVYNAAPNILIKKITFNGRMVQTPLVETYTYDASNKESVSKEYEMTGQTIGEGVSAVTGLPGAAVVKDVNMYKAQIYSYPHYGTGDVAPKLTIEYAVISETGENVTVEKDNQTVDVDFMKKNGVTNLNLERNNLYRLVINQQDGNINFDIIVADWNEGELLDPSDISIVPDEWKVDIAVAKLWSRYIGDGTQETSESGMTLARYAVNKALLHRANNQLAKVGDYYCQNNTVLPQSSLSEAQNAIDQASAAIDSEILNMTELHENATSLIAERLKSSLDSLRNQRTECKNSIVGVVAYLLDKAPKDRLVYESSELKNYRGLVLALHNAKDEKNNEYFKWAKENSETYSLGETYSTPNECWSKDSNGFTKTQLAVKNEGVNLATNHPAINAAYTYNNGIPAQSEQTTGWYLPSQNEMWDICGPDGLGKMEYDDYMNPSKAEDRNYSIFISSSECLKNISEALKSAGGDFSIATTIYVRFWTTSQGYTYNTKAFGSRDFAISSTSVWYDWAFDWLNPDNTFNDGIKSFRVRPILAFK